MPFFDNVHPTEEIFKNKKFLLLNIKEYLHVVVYHHLFGQHL
jgi:hypothetical protein